MQIGGLARRARIAAAIAVGAVAELAVRLLVEQPVAEGDVLGAAGERDDNLTSPTGHDFFDFWGV